MSNIIEPDMYEHSENLIYVLYNLFDGFEENLDS